MTKKIRIADLPEFDITAHLDSKQAMAEYLTVVLEEKRPRRIGGCARQYCPCARHERDSQSFGYHPRGVVPSAAT